MAWELESKNQLEDTTKTAQPNWEFEPVKIPNQTVLDDKTGEAYSVPVTMDGTDTQFAIDTQTKGEDKNNYFAKVSMLTGFNPDDFVKMGVNNAFGKKVFEDVQSPVEVATAPARAVARGVVDFVGGFSTLADSYLKDERETREYKYMLEQRKKGEQSFLKDLGNTLSNVGIGGLQIKRFSNLYKAYTTPKEDLDRAIESASKVIDTIEKSKKQKRDFFKNVGESIITDKELAQNKTLGVIRDLSSATVSVGTSVAATMATKNPTVAAAIVSTAFGLQQSEESYEKAIEGGYDPYTARAYGDIQGGLNAALEFVGTKLLSNFAHLAPIKKLTDSSSKLIMKKLLTNKGTLETAKKIGRAAMKRGYLKDAALSGLGESWEEISQSLAVDIGDNIMGLESFSLGEIISRALYNGAIAIIPSAGTGAVGGIAYNRKINQIHNNLMQQAQQLAPDLTQQEASNFADAAMEVLYQQSADYADATNEIVQKELDPDTIPDNPQTPQELSDNMERILRETYGYSDEEIKKMVDTLNKSIDTSHQYADTYNQLYNALTGAGRSAAESDQASRLFAARALTIAQAEGTTADEVVKRWHLQFKGHQYKYMPADIAEKAKADKSGDMSQYIEQAEQEYNKVLADNNIDYTSMDYDEKAKQAAMFIKTAPVDATLNAPVSDEMLSEVDWVQQDELAKQQDLARTMYQLDQVGTEYTGETININGVEKTVYNSNGDRIAKSEEALRAFYNWFGDSKVVDEQGRPLVVYHGTRAGRKFSVFRTEKTAWVSPNKSYAGAFTTKSFYDTPHENKIFSLYVRLKNPLYVGDIDGIADPKAIKRLSDYTGLSVENLENMKTGENIFTITNTEAFKKAIQEKGYDGLEAIEGRTRSFGVFDPNQMKSTSNRGTYSLTDDNIYMQNEASPRGSYTQRGKFNIIELFQTANPSTIIHEMAHFFLNDLRMYQDNPTTKRQLNAIYKYVGSTDGNITTEQHEYFARSFEAYLMEGKAPNNTLKQVFNRFKNWLTRIYREVKTLDVQLDDNIRSVFDEMLGGKSLDYSLNKGRSNFDERVLSGEIKPSAVKERIARLLKWAEPRTRGGKVVGRFPDIKINQQFDYIREKIGMDKTEAQSKIEDNTKLIDAIIRGDETGDIDALAWENKLLGIAAGKTNARLLLDVYNSVSEMYNTGRFAESVTGSLKKARRQRMLNTLMNTIEQGAGAEWRKGSSKLKQAIRNIGRSYTGWNGLLDMLSMYDKGSKVGESALNQMYSVYDEELNMRYNVAKDGELLSDILGKKLKASDPNGISVSRYINGLQKKTLIEWGANSKEFTKDEIIDIYMKAKDEETRKIMLEDDILQYNEEFLARIDENMTTEDIAFAESLFEFYDKTYEKLNNFYADHYGVALGKRKYYSPRSMDRAGIDVSTGDLSSYAGLSNVKKRTAKGGAIKIKGAYNVLNSYIANSNHWMAFADKLIDINSGFGDTKVKNIIRSVWGEDMNKRIAQEISRFATNDKAFAQKFDGWFSKLRANYAVSVLGAKPSITIKQLVSFPAYWENMSAKEFVAGVVDFARHPKQAIETLSKSKLMQTRGVNIIRDLEIVSNSERLKNLGTKTGFREFLMLNVQLGDRGAIYLGGWAVYKKVLAETGSEEKAMAAFEKVTNETQQSSFMSEQSSWQSNPFGALFTMFQSSQNQYLRKEINAVRGLLTGRMDAKKVGKTLFIYHFLLPMLFQFVSDGFRWDKDKQFRAATLGSLNGAFILGDMLDRIADFFITKQLNLKKDVSELIPFLTTIQNTAKFISKTAQFAGDDISLEDYVEALGRFSQSVGEFTGLPIKYIKDVALNTDEYLEDEEYTKAGLLWLGWSPYALRDINNE